MMVCLILSASSCKKDEFKPVSQNGGSFESEALALFTGCAPSATCGQPVVSALMAGQTISAGNVTVSNDNNNVYVTYTCSGNWKIKKIHVFAGLLSNVPVNNGGNPQIGHFPHNVSFAQTVTCHTVTIPNSALPANFTVAAHAELVIEDENGVITASETGWAAGTRFTSKGSWATYFSASQSECPESSEGCSFSQGYWFANPNAVWPSPITIGGQEYTQAEGVSIWNSSNAGGIADSKKCFLQVAAIYLSGASVDANASVWADVSVCEMYLSGLSKLSPSNLPDGNSGAAASAGMIGDWISTNHCQ